MEHLKTGTTSIGYFLLFLSDLLNSNPPGQDVTLPMSSCWWNQQGESHRHQGQWARREGGGHPPVPRCALPWPCSAIQSWHHSVWHQSQRPSCWGTGYSHPQASSWCHCSVQGETVTFRWIEISNGFEQHLKEKGNFFPLSSWLKLVFFSPPT